MYRYPSVESAIFMFTYVNEIPLEKMITPLVGIIGNGAIGSTLHTLIDGSCVYGRNNSPQLQTHGTLIVAAPNGNRINILADPAKDLEDCNALIKTLKQCRYDRLIYISTLDVCWSDSKYADNRRYLEDNISNLHNYHIMRIGKAFAPDLPRSVLWDIKNNSKWLPKTNLAAANQWYPLSRFETDAANMISNGTIFEHFSSAPITNGAIVEYFAPHLTRRLSSFDTEIANVHNKDGKYTIPNEQVWQHFKKYFVDNT